MGKRPLPRVEPQGCQLLLAPNKELLAVVWHFSTRLLSGQGFMWAAGLSIHSAISGDLQRSMLLTEGPEQEVNDTKPSWLRCSSQLSYVSNGGLLRSMTS